MTNRIEVVSADTDGHQLREFNHQQREADHPMVMATGGDDPVIINKALRDSVNPDLAKDIHRSNRMWGIPGSAWARIFNKPK